MLGMFSPIPVHAGVCFILQSFEKTEKVRWGAQKHLSFLLGPYSELLSAVPKEIPSQMSFENSGGGLAASSPVWVLRLLSRPAACVLQPGRNASGQEKADKEGK